MWYIKDSENLRIPFQVIRTATHNFNTLIGRGGYGPVYRGQLIISGELTVVAVKRLQSHHYSLQGRKEFLTEIQLLSRYKHQNLVSLVGFCEEPTENFLIYLYAEHGSLDGYLKPIQTSCPLTWKQRINICIDAARGLDHLHNHVAKNQRVIHRDIKSGNILLDHNWKAMIADFGFSKIGRANENESYLITNPCGTHGYCDPAYFKTGILTKESDIYSFGVVLFEVLCGRLCYINVNSEERFLAPLAQRYFKEGKLNLIIDGDLKNHINSDSMKEFSEIAFQCLHDDRDQRPSMGLVLQKLEKALKLLNMEEALELLELEEALDSKKLVETLQRREAWELQELVETLDLEKLVELQIQEAWELQKLTEALDLEKLVKTLQMQEAWELKKLMDALKLEEAQELQKLMEALDLEKLVETLQMQEAHDLPNLMEALDLEKLVETLQMQEAQDLQNLMEALELEKLVETLQMQEAQDLQNLMEALELEVGESRTDFEVIKAIYDMSGSPLSNRTRDEVYSLLSSGILIDKGKVWLSINNDGKTQEMISAIQVLPRDGGYRQLSEPESRFSKVAMVFIRDQQIQVKIRTHFLSSNVTYAAYLVCKPVSLDHMEQYAHNQLVYTLNNTQTSYASYPSMTEDNKWWMFELFQTISLKRSVRFKVTFREWRSYLPSLNHLLFEGIQFWPIQKFEGDEIENSLVINMSTSNIEWDNRLPSDYKQFLYYSDKEMMLKPQTKVIFPTKKDAYSVLSKGLLIKVTHEVNMWFWITKLHGKKCCVLPPTLLSYDKELAMPERIASKESRIENVLHILPSKSVGMRFEVPGGLLSTNTTYGCYLVYKMPQCLSSTYYFEVMMKLDDGNVLEGPKFTYLTVPQKPVIGSHSLCRSLSPMNKLKTIRLPRKREDGWLEVNLGNKSDIQWMNIQHDVKFDHFWRRESPMSSCFHPCILDNEPGSVLDNKTDDVSRNSFTLDPRYFSNITIYMWALHSVTPKLILQGIEFRPI